MNLRAKAFESAPLRSLAVVGILLAVSCGGEGHQIRTLRTPTAGPVAGSGSATPVATFRATWPTYHADPARMGRAEGADLWSAVSRAWSSERLDGDIYAEPLIVGDHIIAATENDSVYALDATTGSTLWHARLGDPLPGRSLPCGNIDPSGITSTPVADPASGLVYAVAFTQPGQHELVALDIATGDVRFRRPIDPPGADPHVEQQRSALALAAGRVYVAFGGLIGDCGDYHGWIVASRADGSGGLLSYRIDAVRGAGIWSPSGPAIDETNSLFVATGNSDAKDTPDQGESVLRLSPDLQVLDSFTPRNWSALNHKDIDLGSTSPALLSGGLLAQIGKSGVAYLLRASQLGGLGGELTSAPICRGAYGGTAYAQPYLYVACRDGLAAIRIDDSTATLSVAWRGPSFDAGPPILAGGAVWTADLRAGALYALDPATGQQRFRQEVGPMVHFTTPSAADGRLFIAADQRVAAFLGE